MSDKRMTRDEIHRAGLDVLRRELGLVGMIRCLQQYDSGSGDYSKDRHALLDGVTLDDIVRDIERLREERQNPSRDESKSP